MPSKDTKTLTFTEHIEVCSTIFFSILLCYMLNFVSYIYS